MAQQTINVGTEPNDGTGDPLRTAGLKVNSNFDELYQHKEGFGFFDYNDSSTTLSPVTLSNNIWTDVPNDTLGSYTNLSYKPSNVSSLIDASTGYLDFTELSLGAEIIVRNDFTITPQTNNALLQVRYVLGGGGNEYTLLFWSERLDSGSGSGYQRVITFPIYMGDTNTRDNPAKLQIKLSTAGTLVNAGSYISIKGA